MLGACYLWEMRLVAASLMLVLGLALPAGAQGLFGASPHQPSTEDKTGTNPLNLQQQIDVTNVYAELDDLYLNTTTYSHVVPLFHRRVAVSGGLPYTVGNLTGRAEGGLGDIVATAVWTPWLARRGGIVAGVRTTWDTATVDALGLGTNTVMPYAQLVFHASPRTIVAPFVAYRRDVGGEEFAPQFNDTLVGLYAVWRATPRVWVSAQPQIIFDTALDATYGEVGGEAGFQLSRHISTYVHPSVGLGSEGTKPYTWAVTAGVRVVP
jgi:hypothetical protein